MIVPREEQAEQEEEMNAITIWKMPMPSSAPAARTNPPKARKAACTGKEAALADGARATECIGVGSARPNRGRSSNIAATINAKSVVPNTPHGRN